MFSGCAKLASIVLPDTLTYLGDSAFEGCTGLVSITLGKDLSAIGEKAFKGCVNLTAIVLPDAVSYIGANAFEGCASLTEIRLPAMMTELNNYVFSGCTSLRSAVLPEGMSYVGDYAFKGCANLKNANLPKALSYIGNYAFDGCRSLSSIVLPDELSYLGDYAFRECRSLTEISLTAAVGYLGKGAFINCSSLSSAVLPDTLSSISDEVFKGCSSLSSVTLPTALETLGVSVFENCANLTEIAFPSKLINIGTSAFAGCSDLERVELPAKMTTIVERTFADCTGLKVVVIPEKIASIHPTAFDGCAAIEEVHLPDGLAKWYGVGFGQSTPDYYCSVGSKAAVVLGSIGESYVDPDEPDWKWISPTALENYVAGYRGDERTILVPENAYGIANEAFMNDQQVHSILLPDGLAVIGDYGFANSALKHIAFGSDQGASGYASSAFSFTSRLVSIGKEAFANTAISNVVLPVGLAEIGEGAFNNCDNLQSLTIPRGVTQIPAPIASGCDNLTQVVLPVEVTSIADGAFGGNVETVLCPAGSAASEWAEKTGCKVEDITDVNYQVQYSLIATSLLVDPQIGSVFNVGDSIPVNAGAQVLPVMLEGAAEVKCEVSDPEIAAISGGMLTFLKPGTVELTYTTDKLPEASLKQTVTVYNPVESFILPDGLMMDMNDASAGLIRIEVTPADANPYFRYETAGQGLSAWMDNSKDEFRMPAGSESGLHEFVVESHSGASESITVLYYKAIGTLTADAPDGTLYIGHTYQPNVTVVVDGETFVNEPMLYTLASSNTAVIEPTADGKLLTLSAGRATITVTGVNGESASFDVIVLDVQSLILPAMLTRIEANAFRGTASKLVMVPDGCRYIGEYAFADSAVQTIYIPESVDIIEAGAFDGCNVLIVTTEGSAAQKYAVANGLEWKAE